MSTVIEKAAPAADTLSYILQHTTPKERDRLLQGLQAVVSQGDRRTMQRFIEAFLVTIEMREHPDYKRQFQAFVELVRSGKLFEGTPLSGVPPADIKAV